jgi:hypothetical protein
MHLDRLPSIITENEFTTSGLVRRDQELLVPAYVASQLGFSDLKDFLKSYYRRLEDEAGVLALCPFAACREYLDFDALSRARSIDQLMGFWHGFNSLVGPVNYGELMPRSRFMIAILDGGHALDDGVSAEIAYYATEYRGQKPIIAIRSDIRLAENPAAPINPADRYFLDEGPYGNHLLLGPGAYDSAVPKIKDLADRIRKEAA